MFQGAHAEQHLFAVHARHDDRRHLGQAYVTQAQVLQLGAVAGDAAVGGTQGDRGAGRQAKALGDPRRHRHLGGAGVEQEGHGLAVDAAVQPVMPLAAAGQTHFDVTVAVQRLGRAIGVVLAVFPDAEVTRGQDQADAPGEHQHDSSRAFARRLRGHCALQPPFGAEKRQTIGRRSPSARALPPLSRPTQAPSASIHKASATPKGTP
ncbi:hypothetical protein D9M70_431360 [compost metagenome]